MLFFFNVCEEVLKIYRWIQGRLFSNVWLLGFMKRGLVLFAVGAVIMIMSILIMASWFSDYVPKPYSAYVGWVLVGVGFILAWYGRRILYIWANACA